MLETTRYLTRRLNFPCEKNLNNQVRTSVRIKTPKLSAILTSLTVKALPTFASTKLSQTAIVEFKKAQPRTPT